MSSENAQNYNSAKIWQIALFALNNSATNVMYFALMYLAVFSQNILGIAAVTIGIVITSMRIFDGITDPIIGLIIDKTKTKFGKYRPAMLFGNILIISSIYTIFAVVPNLEQSMKFPVLVLVYIVYVIGYTFQTACTKAAQSSLTNDPKQRPLFTLFDAIYTSILFMLLGLIFNTWLPPKFQEGYESGMLNPEFWKTLGMIYGGISLTLTIFAIIGISGRDKEEFWGTGSKSVEVKFKDYLPLIKSNRAIQMLIIAAATDKLAGGLVSATSIYLFGNVLMNVSLAGQIGALKMPITVLLTIVGIRYASKLGQKKAFVGATWISMGCLIAILIIQPFENISLTEMNTNTVLFLGLTILQGAAAGISNGIAIPMIADCADYEASRTGKFMPGMMGTLFSFVDKLVSSLSSTLIGFGLAFIGMADVVIAPNTPADSKFFWFVMGAAYIAPILGHVASIIAMKFYPLDGEKMKEVQAKLATMKEIGLEVK